MLRSRARELILFKKSRFDPVSRKIKNVKFDEGRIGHGSGISVGKRQTKDKGVPSISLNNIVHFEDDAKTLINHLMEETEELDVISITGMPGIGKTTLAWKIYQNENIRKEFPTRIWISLREQFNIKDFYLDILKEFTEQDDHSLSDYNLTHDVFEFLDNRKFLLVVEDVWTVDAWNDIWNVLPKNNKLSKVLITSRNKRVAMHASSRREPHMLRFLNKKESWELLQLQVLGKVDSCPEWLKSRGEVIAENCGGLPLMIEVIGSALVVGSSTGKAKDLTVNWWKEVSENVMIYVKDYMQHHVFGILELSYNQLPYQLKRCFLYLGVFPEDYEIPVWTLTRLWIAEGFVQDEQQSSLEEIAKQNLCDLVNHNLLMVDKIKLVDEVKTCRVHKLIWAFCTSKAAKENLFQEIKFSEEGAFDPKVSLMPNCRRLCIYSHPSEFLSRKPYGPVVRSLLCFDKEPMVLDPIYISAIPKSFKKLRVFESKSIKFTEFPKKLTQLMNLKYISLCCDDLSVLPESIAKLWNLQTLLVKTQSPSVVMKANIWRMIHLRHLMTKAAIVLAIQEKCKANCQELQTLSRLSPEHCTEDVFQRAPNLKRLGIRGQLANLSDAKLLTKLDHLESLKLVNDLLSEPASNNQANQLHHLLQPDCFPPHLRRLTLSGTHLNWKHMSLLGNINTLQVLKLKNNAFIGESWNTGGDEFRCLEFFSIGSTDLVSWEASADCFPNLKCLVLKNCEKLRQIPLSLAKSLQKLDIEHVSKSAAESAREIQEEKVKEGRLGEFKLNVGPGCE